MEYNPKIHHRRSIRLHGYDYSQAGFYFITICTQNRTHLFGENVDDEMVLNDAGLMIDKWYFELENKFHDIQCHQMVIMPNHTHFIVQNVGADLRVCPEHSNQGTHSEQGEHAGSPLHRVVQWFKTMTTNQYIKMVKQYILPPFNNRIWQRNYWEHIIRNDDEYRRISQYIIDNPEKWGNDKLNGGIGNHVMESPAIYNEAPWMV